MPPPLFNYLAIYAVILHIVSEGTWISHLRLPFLVVLLGPTTMVGFLCLSFTSMLCTYWSWCGAEDFRSRSSHLMVGSSSPISCFHSQPLDEQLRENFLSVSYLQVCLRSPVSLSLQPFSTLHLLWLKTKKRVQQNKRQRGKTEHRATMRSQTTLNDKIARCAQVKGR